MSDELDIFPGGMARAMRREALMLGSMAGLTAIAGWLLPSVAGAAESAASVAPCEILFTIYPGGTLLDFAGPNEDFSRLPNTKVCFASPDGGPVVLEHGVVFGQSERLADVKTVDVICVLAGLTCRR